MKIGGATLSLWPEIQSVEQVWIIEKCNSGLDCLYISTTLNIILKSVKSWCKMTQIYLDNHRSNKLSCLHKNRNCDI